jgi:hypothetical protein
MRGKYFRDFSNVQLEKKNEQLNFVVCAIEVLCMGMFATNI